MRKDVLLAKALKHYKSFESGDSCIDLVAKWVDAVFLFDSKCKKTDCSEALMEVQFFVLAEFANKDYLVRKDAIFGDLFEIRTQGFENRYLINTKLCKTYKAAYEKTELEYGKTFNKKRYSSYDSFRQIRSRRMKKKDSNTA